MKTSSKTPSHVYPRKDSPFLWATIYVRDPASGQRKRKRFSTETDDVELATQIRDRFQAEADAAAMETDAHHHFTRERAESLVNLLLRWHGVDPQTAGRSNSPKWSTFSEQWLKDLDLTDRSAGTRTNYRSLIARFSNWLEKTRKAEILLHEIDRSVLQDFHRYLRDEEGLRPVTIHSIIRCLSVVFNTAVDDEILTRNPAAKMKIPGRSDRRHKEPFTQQDVTRMIQLTECDESIEHRDEWKTIILFGLCTGARLLDCARRDWSEITIINAHWSIQFTPQKTKRHNKTLTVPIEDPLLSHLQSLHQELGEPDRGPICQHLHREKVNNHRGLSARFRKILEKAEITRETQAPEGKRAYSWHSKSFHSFRATLPSLMSQAMVPPEVRMRIVGHTQLATHQLYTHLQDQQLRDAIRGGLALLQPGEEGPDSRAPNSTISTGEN